MNYEDMPDINDNTDKNTDLSESIGELTAFVIFIIIMFIIF